MDHGLILKFDYFFLKKCQEYISNKSQSVLGIELFLSIFDESLQKILRFLNKDLLAKTSPSK